MAPARKRAQLTQEDEARARWDRLFLEEEKRQRALARIEVPSTLDDSEDEYVTPSPKYDDCLRIQGPDRVVKMCNFSPLEFEQLWETVKDYVLARWNVGRGKKSTSPPKDILFMALVALKHCGTWDIVSSMFEMDASPFQKMVKKFLVMIEPFMYETFVVNEGKRWSMRELNTTGKTFRNFPCARYATDVTFQQADKPSGGSSHVKTFFSSKHLLYGYKVEVSVLPNGTAINCADFAPGAESDVSMFRGNASFHRSSMQKLPDEKALPDEGPLADCFENDWAVLVGKEYQDLTSEFRTIQPKKKTRGGPPLTMDERRENDLISQDRVIAESFFGRMKTLWGVCYHKWEWDRKHYNMYFRVCLALTNYSVRCSPLRREDGENFLRYEARLRQIGAEIEAAAKEKRREYRDNRAARLALCPRPTTRPRTSNANELPYTDRRDCLDFQPSTFS